MGLYPVSDKDVDRVVGALRIRGEFLTQASRRFKGPEGPETLAEGKAHLDLASWFDENRRTQNTTRPDPRDREVPE